MDTREEITALRLEVAALKSTLDVLVELLHQADAFGPLDRHQVERKLTAARIRAREEHVEHVEPADANVLAQTAYRGPVAGSLACASCRKPLAEDDPELTLKGGARVCPACFQRKR